MTQTEPQAPQGVPAWLLRLVAAVTAVGPSVLAWIDPGNKLPHGAIQACVILASLIVGAVIFSGHALLAAVHEYGWSLKAVETAGAAVDAEVHNEWPQFKSEWALAQPVLGKVQGVADVTDQLAKDVADLKSRAGAGPLTPTEVVAALEAATGMTFPRVTPPAPPAAPAPAAG